MQVIRLDRRYRAYHKGFRVAVMFDPSEPFWEFEMSISRYYPEESFFKPHSWMTWRGKSKERKRWFEATWAGEPRRFVAVRDERIIPLILLQIS